MIEVNSYLVYSIIAVHLALKLILYISKVRAREFVLLQSRSLMQAVLKDFETASC